MTLLESTIRRLRTHVADERSSPVTIGRLLARLAGGNRDQAAEEVGLSRRTAYYLASVARAIDAKLITEAAVAEIGWTRARVLAARALKFDKPVTQAEVRQAVATSAKTLAATPINVGPRREILEFALTKQQATAVRRALKEFGAPTGAGPSARASALATICRAAAGRRPQQGPK